MMISPTHTHCTLRAVREANNTHFSRTPEELDLPIDATARIYGTTFVRLKTGCSHSPSQICGSLHTSQHVLASANATCEKLLKQTSCMTCLKRQIKACSCGEKWTRHCLCQVYDLFFLNRCVRVGWKFPSPVEFSLLG